MPLTRSVNGSGNPILWMWLGRMGYTVAMELMERLAGQVGKTEIPGILIFLEHPRVITFGKRVCPDDIVASTVELEKRGINVFRTERGGRVTCHGPGQLIGYIILNLAKLGLGVKELVRGVEETLKATLADWNIDSSIMEDLPGIWVQNKKIAAIGMRVKNNVTSHGFALNMNFDLETFDLVVPCGMAGIETTNLSDHSEFAPDLPEAARVTAEKFGQVFGIETLEVKEMEFLREPVVFFDKYAKLLKEGEAA